MNILTPEQIADACADLDGAANIAAINSMFREQDESHLFPISGRFNATERAIRWARKQREEYPSEGLEYALLLDAAIGAIVNAQV